MTRPDLALHLVTDERLPFTRLRDIVHDVADAVTVVQLRAKTLSARDLIAQAAALSDAIRGRAALLVDDRLDVVLAARDAGARVDGVHLGQSDVPPETARRVLGPSSIVGWTAHTSEHLAAAAAMPIGTVDYLGVGVIRPTSTKPDHPEPLGVAGFADLARSTTTPCVAIGGVQAADLTALRAHGAAGVAVVSAICGADDPAQAARALRDGMRR